MIREYIHAMLSGRDRKIAAFNRAAAPALLRMAVGLVKEYPFDLKVADALRAAILDKSRDEPRLARALLLELDPHVRAHSYLYHCMRHSWRQALEGQLPASASRAAAGKAYDRAMNETRLGGGLRLETIEFFGGLQKRGLFRPDYAQAVEFHASLEAYRGLRPSFDQAVQVGDRIAAVFPALLRAGDRGRDAHSPG